MSHPRTRSSIPSQAHIATLRRAYLSAIAIYEVDPDDRRMRAVVERRKILYRRACQRRDGSPVVS
jgi:hypothetical protein